MVQTNISLKPYNSFGIDVSAEWFAAFSSADELRNLLKKSKNENKLIIGGGSNILFTKDVQGYVLKNELKGIELVNEDENYFYVKANGGEVWHEFVLHCIENNYAGVENLSLIPGCVGASPMQNIGAYGVEIKDVFHELEALSIEDFSVQKFSGKDCAFGYRESVFKRKLKNKFIILNVTYRLNKRPKFNIEYGAIKQELEKMDVQDLSIQNISQAVINIRQSKLPNPKEIGNAGSFFKNPAVSEVHYLALKEKYPNIPAYEILNSSDKKIAAGWLIEQCGWKGFRENNYGVHSLQALVLVNYGGASGKDIYNLSGKIIESVKEKFGVELEREVNII
ncbi:UDP-N-acetylmuramate dehydrogenase [Arachidicoccus ginsenosidimutans]|uniref:UDP-N-acetylmuramate dehydrogenase n=1 Tax=Arachidicoccus sp. BS20 TaxID=1850526 RepID=UPI000AA41909|nr:UDP-N-acetylmuramate dehydrogenase [Arachidicoccus sp. BS20]